VRGSETRNTTEMYVPLALGFLASAAFVTAAATGAGQALAGAEAAGIVAGVCLVILAALELTSVRRGPLRRQTSPGLPRVFGPRVGALLWGLDTGSMVSTVRTTFGAHAVLIACIVGVAGAWAGVAYAVGFCVPLGVSLYAPLAGGSTRPGPSSRLFGSLRAARVALSGLMVGLAVVLIA
jgi:hypothetical protein